MARQQCPDDTGMLVRHRHRGPVFPAALAQLSDPLAAPVCCEPDPPHRRPRPMDEECAQRAVATCADAPQALLPARGMLAGHQPQPGGTLATVFEGARLADG